MPDTYAKLASQLDALTAELQQLQLWGSTPPPASALASSAPFCHDTLSFQAWLQWVFIPRARALVDARAPLPPDCNIAPMAELSFGETEWNSDDLIALLRGIDRLFASAHGRLR
jgi:uncharacterized protein YqcC (DUF446 family)